MYLNIFIGFIISIVIITTFIQTINSKKNVKEHLENCQYGQKSATAKGSAFFTNSMWSSFFQRDQALNQLEENDVKTRKKLDDYKTNILRSNSEYAGLESQYNAFNNNMDTEFRKLHNQLEKNKEKAKQSKQTATDKFNSIDNKMNAMVGSPGDDLESKLKPFVDTAIQTNLNNLANTAIDDVARQPGLRNRWTAQAGSGNIHNWQIIPGLGCPMRVDPESGNVQCLSYDGRNCEWNYVSQNGQDLTKIDAGRVNALSCGDDHRRKYGSDGYSAGNHWCRTVYNTLSKNLTEVDWNMCPVGWTRNNATGTSCNAPSDYSGPCARTSGFAGYSDQGKQGWAQSCLARWPFKVNVNSAVSSLTNMNSEINKNVQGKLGNLVPKSNLDTLVAYNNGVYVKAFKLNTSNNSRGNMIQDGLITTNINFNWGVGLIFGIRDNPNITNTDAVYMELIGFIKVPAGASVLKFRLTSDDGSRLFISENGEISGMKLLIDMWQNGGSRDNTWFLNVRSNTYLPFVVQYYERYGSASLKLEWSINYAPFAIIPRAAFYINKDICNYQFNFNLINEINNNARSLILNLQNIFNYLSQYLNEFKTPAFYEYNLDGSASHIGDGGRDMFDNGNYISIRNGNSISGELSYATTTPTIVNVGGANAQYISLGYARPLIMLAKSAENGLWGFRKRGNIGSDGAGEKRFDVIFNGEKIEGFTVYARAVNWRDRNSDPTTCDVFFWIGGGSSQMFGQPNLINPSDGNDNYDYSFTMQCINTLFGSMLLSNTHRYQFVEIGWIQQSIRRLVFRLSQVYQ
jgi:CPW-WPC domain-containing protein